LSSLMRRVRGYMKSGARSLSHAVGTMSPADRASASNLLQGVALRAVTNLLKRNSGLGAPPTAAVVGRVYDAVPNYSRGGLSTYANQFQKSAFSGTDGVPVSYAGTDGVPVGAGFFGDLGGLTDKVVDYFSATDEVRSKMMKNSRGLAKAKTRRTTYSEEKPMYAATASMAEFPIIDDDGALMGALKMRLTGSPVNGVSYGTPVRSRFGTAHFDSRFTSVPKGDSAAAVDALRIWLDKNPTVGTVYISVTPVARNKIYGRSWEASLLLQLAGKQGTITGKVDSATHRGDKSTYKIGPIVGASQKAKLGEHVIFPAANADEVPLNRSLTSITI